MNTFDASYFCPFCSEQYSFCGCDQEDSGPFSAVSPCQNCGFETAVRFQFGGDPTQRCLSCHNNARMVGVSTTEEDWF